ncbi:MAG: NADH:flavin oxidoreductase [Planctomycetota bacterium]
MSLLFEKGKIGSLEIPNRIIRSATNERMAATDGSATLELIQYNVELAHGGVGLITGGNTHIRHDSAGTRALYIDSDDMIQSHKRLTNAIHNADSLIFAQLNHSGRQKSPEGKIPIAPSPVPLLGTIPSEITEKEISWLIEQFGECARRVKEAGYNGVQLHAAHGFLISQFNSPYTNRRNDAWGGSPEKRMRFIIEVTKNVRGKIGKSFPLTVKINVSDLKDGGLEFEEACKIIFKLQELAVDAVEISSGIADSDIDRVRELTEIAKREGALHRHFTQELKRKGLKIPLILVGCLRKRRTCEEILQKREADFVSFSRPFIREVAFPKRWENGDLDDLACESCDTCSDDKSGPIKCKFN